MRKLIILFLVMMFLVPVSAMASTTLSTDKTIQTTNIKVGNIVNGEEVLWVNSEANLGANDVAYLTSVKTEQNTANQFGYIWFYNYDRTFTVNARSSYGVLLFWTRAQGHWHYQWESGSLPPFGVWSCRVTNTGCDYGVYSSLWRKNYLCLDYPKGTSYAYINTMTAYGYFLKGTHPGYAKSVIKLTGHLGTTVYSWEIVT